MCGECYVISFPYDSCCFAQKLVFRSWNHSVNRLPPLQPLLHFNEEVHPITQDLDQLHLKIHPTVYQWNDINVNIWIIYRI